jgi:16S rRNA (cytidine1402-2'-O)-methyltransferase
MAKMGTLFLVATPIGNLEDISARALRVLSEAMIIAAEDTRRTRKLLDHYQIRTPLTSYHEHNKLTKLDTVLTALVHGDVALVSDAGMPGLNDPGFELVRAALQAGHPVSPIPGPSAPISALVASGLPTDAYLYLGYLPRKSPERRQKILEVAELPYTLVVLETPHRLLSALQDLLAVLGDRQIAVARELTKLHEEILRVTLSQALAHFQTEAPRGEFTLVIAGKPSTSAVWDEARLRRELEQSLRAGEAVSQVAARLTNHSGWQRRKVYQMATEIKKIFQGK